MSLLNHAGNAGCKSINNNSFAENVLKSLNLNFANKFGFKKFNKNGVELKIFSTNPIKSNEDYLVNLALREPKKFIEYFVNDTTLENAMNTNPRIKAILEDNHLPVKYCLNNVLSIIDSHLIPVAKLAKKTYAKLDKKTNSQNYINLYIAALLHDIGKVFMPEEILNKNSRLSLKEKEIIKLHNVLSYEILKTTNINQKIAQLTLEHHNYNNDVVKNPQNQVLTACDIYCALREKRPYKKSLGYIAAKTIMYDMGANGALDITYIHLI